MKINFILPEAGLFGGIKAVRQLADATVRRGHDLRIAYPIHTDVWPKLWQCLALYRKCRSRLRLVGKPRDHLQGSLARLIAVRKQLVEAGDVPDADVTIGTWWRTLEWMDGWPPAKGMKVHYVQGNDGWDGADSRIKAAFEKPWLKLAVSGYLKRLVESQDAAQRCHLIPNGIEKEVFRFTERKRQEPPRVGFVYSRDKVKDVETAIGALEIVQQRLPGVQVLAFGAYDLLKEHRRLHDFQFVLRPKPAEIAKIYASCDCWIMSSLSEGFSLPPLEAAACGCPMVCTDCGGPADYVVEGVNGHMVPVRDRQAMADRIIGVLGLSETNWVAMSHAAATTAERYDWDVSAQCLEQVLTRALNRNQANDE